MVDLSRTKAYPLEILISVSVYDWSKGWQRVLFPQTVNGHQSEVEGIIDVRLQ